MSSSFRIDNKELLKALGLAQTTKTVRDYNHSSSRTSLLPDSEYALDMMNKKGSRTTISTNDAINDDDGDRGEFLFAMDIDITDTEKDRLEVYTKDKPYHLARAFCKKHGIEKTIAGVIASRIVESAKEALRDRDASNHGSIFRDNSSRNLGPLDDQSIYAADSQMCPKDGDDPVDDIASPPKGKEKFKPTIMMDKDLNRQPSQKKSISRASSQIMDDEYTYTLDDQTEMNTPIKVKNVSKENTFVRTKASENISPSPLRSKRVPSGGFYDKTLRDIENRMRKGDLVREIYNQEKYKECSFHPNINPNSLKLAAKKRGSMNVEHILTLKGKVTEVRRTMIKQALRSQESLSNTFRPDINNKSRTIDEKGRSDCNHAERFEDLYQEYKILHEKKIQLKMKTTTEYSFAPKVLHKKSKKQDPEFLKRVAEDIEKRKIKQVEDEEEVKQSLPTFCPTILRGPELPRNTDNLPIGEYLYKISDEIEERKDSLRETYERELREKAPRCTGKSKQIVNSKMKKSIKIIFEALDTDKDGLISSDQLPLETIPKPICDALTPLFLEMKDTQFQKNFEQFFEASMKLLKGADPRIKSYLVLELPKVETLGEQGQESNNKEEFKNSELTFQPTIDKNSEKILEQSEERQGCTFYQRVSMHKTKSEVRLKELKKQAVIEELKECSFRPVINDYPGGTETFYQKAFSKLDVSI